MHIADGVLSTGVCVATGALSTGAVGYSLHKLRDSLADRAVPLTGMMAAMVFAGQMVNFPLGVAPVSGHLIGGVLAAVVLGPWAGCLAITLVLVVQRFLFSDGGLLTLGANVLNMVVVGAIGGYAIYTVVRKLAGGGKRGVIIGSVVAAWMSVMAAAALFCVEFRLSWTGGQFDFTNILTMMVSVHSLIGVGEALITGGVVSFILARRPDLIDQSRAPAGVVTSLARVTAAGVVAALAVGAFFAPFASGLPDGLDATAGEMKFDALEQESPAPGLFGDYDAIPLPAGTWQGLSVALSGILGVVVVFAIAIAMGRATRWRADFAETGRE